MPISPGKARTLSVRNLVNQLIANVELRARQSKAGSIASISNDIDVLTAEIVRKVEAAESLNKPKVQPTQGSDHSVA